VKRRSRTAQLEATVSPKLNRVLCYIIPEIELSFSDLCVAES